MYKTTEGNWYDISEEVAFERNTVLRLLKGAVEKKKFSYCEEDFITCYLLTFSILALMATTIVLTVIKTAPAAGLNKIPCLYKTPAANGNATIL